MQPASPPAAPPAAAPAAVPRMSSVLLYAIFGISVAVIAAIFGFILIYVTPLTTQLWWMGVVGLIFAFVFYMIFASTHNRTLVMPLSGAFFVIGMGSFYGSILTNTTSDTLNKLILVVILSIFVVIILTAMFMMSRQEEQDRVRKSQRKVTP